jgi:hypothetical protein
MCVIAGGRRTAVFEIKICPNSDREKHNGAQTILQFMGKRDTVGTTQQASG